MKRMGFMSEDVNGNINVKSVNMKYDCTWMAVLAEFDLFLRGSGYVIDLGARLVYIDEDGEEL